MPDRVPGHVLQFGERPGAGVAAADEDEGQRGLAERRVPGGGGQVELGEDVVPQRDRLLHAAEADAVLGQSGHRQDPGDRARRQDQDVVGDFEVARRPSGDGRGHRDGGRAGGRPERAQPPVHHPGAGQYPAQRHDDVPGVDRPGGGLGQQRLVGHVRLGVDDREFGLLGAQPLLQPEGGVEADMAASDDQDTGGWGHRCHRSIPHPRRLLVHTLCEIRRDGCGEWDCPSGPGMWTLIH